MMFNPDVFLKDAHFHGEYERCLKRARDDLEKDYPDARVFINYYTPSSPSVNGKVVRLAPPDGQVNVITGHFEVYAAGWFNKGGIFNQTFGYNYWVFSEGELKYDGKVGPDWTIHSDGANVIEGSKNMKTFKWLRKDGSTRFRTTADVDLENWMSKLPDDLLISQITIPGGHDSHALVGTPKMPPHPDVPGLKYPVNWYTKAEELAECQDWPIKEQLRNGVRYFDLRYGDNENMRHGLVALPGNLRDVLKDITDFLDAHPRETVFIMAKWDQQDFWTQKPKDEDEKTCKTVAGLFDAMPRFLDTHSVPTLKECRGHVIRKWEGSAIKQGLDFGKFSLEDAVKKPPYDENKDFMPFEHSKHLTDEQNYWKWRQWKVEQKWANHQHELNWLLKARPQLPNDQINRISHTGFNEFHIDEASIKAQSSISPKEFALFINNKLNEWLTQHCFLAKRYELGVLGLDFIGLLGPDLPKKIVLTNFI